VKLKFSFILCDITVLYLVHEQWLTDFALGKMAAREAFDRLCKLSTKVSGSRKLRLKNAFNMFLEIFDPSCEEIGYIAALSRMVAQLYKVNATTIKSKYYKSLEDKEKQHGNRLLLDWELQSLIGMVRSLSVHVGSVTKPFVRKLAGRILARRDAPPPSASWIRKFFKDHKKLLKVKKAKVSDKTRYVSEIPEAMENWISKTRGYLDRLPPLNNPNLVLNIDETRADRRYRTSCL
jgi:hypothetical protein